MNKDEAPPPVTLRALQGSSPAHLNGVQEILQPFVPALELVWYAVWFASLAIFIATFVLRIETPLTRFFER